MLSVIITTVERKVFDSDSIARVTIPTTSGEVTILPNHVPLMSVLSIGEIRLTHNDDTKTDIFVNGGIFQLSHNHLEILATVAEHAEELDTAKIEEAKRRAEKLIQEQPVGVDIAQVEAALKQELVKEKIVQRRHR